MQKEKPEAKVVSAVKQMGDRAGEPPMRTTPSTGRRDAGEVDKIRDILFGSQIRDYETRFSNLENRLVRELVDVREEVRSRFDSLESYVKKELNSLANRLKAEQHDRTEAIKELLKGLDGASEELEKRAGQLHDLLYKSERDLREQILDQSKSLSDEIQKKRDEGMRALQDATDELRTGKVDRSRLAALLTELVLHLTDKPAADLGVDSEAAGDE